jgi:NodT family efflux transporter outer membrane factor (OMF) lipoprotein
MAKARISHRVWAVALLALGLSGCTVGPKYQPPSAPLPAPTYKESPDHFKEADGWKVAQPSDSMLRGKWWEVFKEPELNALEEQLNGSNQNIKQAYENYMVTRALIREARSQYFPTAATAPAYVRSGSSANLGASSAVRGNSGITTINGLTSSLYDLPVDILWAPDLWGKVRNTVREFQYGAQLSAADLANERLVEQATLAQIFFEIRGQDELQRILDATAEADKKSLELTQARYQTGVDNMLSVVQAQTTLETVEAQRINVGVARAEFEHAIATLVGRPASGFSIPVKPMTTSPPPIPIGLPSQLLERRPDIAAAERSMAEANAQIGIARAAYYPTLTLSASGGLEASTLSNLFAWSSRFWAIGGTLSETLFDAGLRRATVNQFIATYNGAVAFYRQTVLTACQQVEDALASVRILSQQVLQQRLAVESASAGLELELSRYETGIDPYTDVVIAQTTLLSNQQTLVATKVTEMVSAVQLIMALGGGWDRSELPTPEQVSQKPTKGETAIVH